MGQLRYDVEKKEREREEKRECKRGRETRVILIRGWQQVFVAVPEPTSDPRLSAPKLIELIGSTLVDLIYLRFSCSMIASSTLISQSGRGILPRNSIPSSRTNTTIGSEEWRTRYPESRPLRFVSSSPSRVETIGPVTQFSSQR